MNSEFVKSSKKYILMCMCVCLCVCVQSRSCFQLFVYSQAYILMYIAY